MTPRRGRNRRHVALACTSKSRFDSDRLGSRVDGTKPGLEGLFVGLFGDEAAKTMADASFAGLKRLFVPDPADGVARGVHDQQAIGLRDPKTGAAVARRGPGRRRAWTDRPVRERELPALSAKANVVYDDLFKSKSRSLRDRSKDASESHSISRIDFAFDLACWLHAGPFGIKLPGTRPARVPYPVPFSLLGDEAKGWLETSYLGKDVRISRGNKGTTFILVREAEEANGGAPLPYEF